MRKAIFSILRSLILLSMASFIILSLLLFLHFHPHSAADIHQACKATRFPPQCHSSLLPHLPRHPTPLQIIQSAITISSHNLIVAQSKVKSIVDASAANRTRATTAKSCLQVLHYSHYRTSLAAHAFPNGATKDARAWISAALGYQYGCWSGLKYANDTALVAQTMSFLESLTILSSNALSMIVSYDRFGNDTASWRPPLTERDGFWEPAGTEGLGVAPGVTGKLTADVTVCKGGGGCYETVQEAVNAAPDDGERRFVIHIKEGVYEERVRVPLRKRNLVFLGDGMGKTVITGSANVGQPGITTYNSATVGQ